MKRFTMLAAFAAVYVIWGSTYLAIRFLLEAGVPTFLGAAMRHLVAGMLLYGWARSRGSGAPSWVHWRSAWIIGALLPAAGNGLVFWALERGLASGVAALVVATEPLWIALLAAWWQRERMPAVGWIGLLLGFVGVAVLVGPERLGGTPVDPVAGGIVCVAALAWAIGSLYSRNAPSPASSAMGSALMMITGGLILLTVSVARGELIGVDLTAVGWQGWGAWIYLVLMGSVVGLSAYYWLLRNVQPNRVATYAYVNPLIAVGLGWLFAGERLDARIAIATVVVVVGVALMLAARSRRVAAPLPACESTA